jgi:hypothetical protein
MTEPQSGVVLIVEYVFQNAPQIKKNGGTAKPEEDNGLVMMLMNNNTKLQLFFIPQKMNSQL